MDWVGKLIVGAVVGLVGGIANAIVKEKTGKHIHEHAIIAWRNCREKIDRWCIKNPNKASRITSFIIGLIDDSVNFGIKRLNIKVKMDHHITETIVSETTSDPTEIYNKFPGLRGSNCVEVEPEVVGIAVS